MRELLYLRRQAVVCEDRPGQLPSLAEIGRNIIAIIAPDSREVRPRELNLDQIRIRILRQPLFCNPRGPVGRLFRRGGVDKIVGAKIVVVFAQARRILGPGVAIRGFFDNA